MSKSKQNYPDPNLVISKYGADALRLYLIDSPVVHGDSLAFSEAGVRMKQQKIFRPWLNAFNFFMQNANRLAEGGGRMFDPAGEDSLAARELSNVTDQWIEAVLNHLIQFVHQEMKGYRLYTVVPKLVSFIDQFCNWYIRLNRDRMRGNFGEEEARTSLAVMYDVLYNFAVLMAPFTPFIAEHLYQQLREVRLRVMNSQEREAHAQKVGVTEDSVHYQMLPTFDEGKLNEQMERVFGALQEVISLGREARINVRQNTEK